jgi:hypothetical protein
MSYRILKIRGLYVVGGLLLPLTGFAASIVVPAPCANSASTATTGTGASGKGGLRFCKDMLYAPATAPTPGLLAMLSNNVPNPTQSNQPRRGTIQQYADCYYKGYELDPNGVADLTATPNTNVCTLGSPTKVHNFCSIIPNRFNNNTSETTTNMAGTSCGQLATINVALLTTCPSVAVPNPPNSIPSPTASEAAFLAQNNLGLQTLTNPNTDFQSIANQAGMSAARQQQLGSGKKACVSYTLPQPNAGATPSDPSWERTQLAGTYMLALATSTDQVLNGLSCQQSLTIDMAGACYSQAQQVMGLISQLQSATSSLGGAANIGDIDYCQASFPGNIGNGVTAANPNTANLTGTLRQSASFLCSARTKLEAAYGQLAMCNIFSNAQNDYVNKTGTPYLQAQFFSNMTYILDNGSLNASPTSHAGVCGYCKSNTNTAGLQSCMTSCYKANVQPYFQNTLGAAPYWPQPATLNTSCVPGGNVYVGN